MKSLPDDGPPRRELPLVPDCNGGRPCRAFSLPEVRIAVCYVLLASVWIVGSDMLLERLAKDASMTLFLQSFKGLNFVITTGILLFLALRRSFGGWRRSEQERCAEMAATNELFRGLSSRLQTLREEERTRISREIHDELGQWLTAIQMKLRSIESQLEQLDDRGLNGMIDQLVEATGMIDGTIDSVRRISSGLRPPALDHLGLATALEDEAEQFTRRTGIACHLEVGEMNTPVPPAVETTAFRIFQESLTNVARHAKATRVEAECRIDADTLHLRIRDDGVGIDPVVAGHPASLGLVGMHERAADAGGALELHSTPGNGTEVLLRIPLAGSTPTPADTPS